MYKPLMMIALSVALIACTPRVDNRGHVDPQSNTEKIKVGTSYKQDVIRLLGSPSTQSSFGEEAWYYITARRETTAFFAPDVVRQDITRIRFDGNGKVTEVKRYAKEDGETIATVSDITPTEGQELGLWEQMLGNFGRFNKAPGGGSVRGSGGPGGRR